MLREIDSFCFLVGRKKHLIKLSMQDVKLLDKFNIYVKVEKKKSGEIRKRVMAYAKGGKRAERVVITLKKIITNCKHGNEIVHANGDELDLRKTNLHILH